MRLLVCGSRNWTDFQMIHRQLLTLTTDVTVIHGAQRGADMIAGTAANMLGMKIERYPADWKRYDKAAGPIRNQQMLDTGIDEVWAFKDGFDHELRSGGTEHMVRIARAAGVPTVVYCHD